MTSSTRCPTDITGTGTGTGVIPERHVAVFPFPFASHPPLLLSLVRRLASAAPTVTFSFFNTAKSNRSLFSDPISGDNVRHYDVSDGVPVDYVSVGNFEEYVSLFLAVAEGEYRRCIAVAEAEVGVKIGCVVADAFLWFSGEMAEQMNVPWVAFWASGVCSLSTHFYTDLITQQIGIKGTPWREDETVDFIPGFTKVRLGDLPAGIISGDLDSTFATMLRSMVKTLGKATAIPVSSFEEFELHLTKDLTSKLNNFLNIGPFNLVSPQKPSSQIDKYSCISWLDGQKPGSVAYICFGTMATPPPPELAAAAEALEETKTPFLWSIKEDSMKDFPKGFVERMANGAGKFVPWAPQLRVLGHGAIGVFVNHGGWNSVVESVCAGVPMICRPFFGDHHIDTWMVENVWGNGVRVQGGVFTKTGTCRALRQVLGGDGSMKERTSTLKKLAHEAVGPNGSSTKNFKILLDIITSKTL